MILAPDNLPVLGVISQDNPKSLKPQTAQPIPTHRNNPCGICGDTSGDCREVSYGFWCHDAIDGLSTVNGYLYRKPTVDGVWGIWATDTGALSPAQRENHRQKQAALAALAQSNQRTITANTMAVAERDRHYRDLLSQLELNEVDRADLTRRGFTAEQIERYGFKSIERHQRLSGTYPLNLPGISKDGTHLDNWHVGYLCPVPNAAGQLQGFQIRNRHYDGQGAKYPWLSRSQRNNPQGFSAHLENGQLPVGVYWPDERRVFDTVAIAEGFGLKPQLAANRLGMPVIGCDAANIASRPENFKQALADLSGGVLPNILYLPDAGDVANHKVMRRIKTQYQCLCELGLETDILWWEQFTKADGDIDDISDERLAQAVRLPWAEFMAKDRSQPIQIGNRPLAKKVITPPPVKLVQQLDERKAISIQAWKAQKHLARDLEAYAKLAETYPGCDAWERSVRPSEPGYRERARQYFYSKAHQLLTDMAEPVERGYAVRLPEPEGERGLDVLDISKGGGKTSRVLIPKVVEAARLAEKTLVYVPTRELSRRLKNEINAKAGEAIAKTHLDDGFRYAKIIVSCGESAYKLKGMTFTNVFIDECNEVVERMQSGSLGTSPTLSLNAFEWQLRHAQYVMIATDKMWGASVQAVKRMGKFTTEQIRVQRRVRPKTKMKIIEYRQFTHWLAVAVEAISQGKKVCIPCGAQTKARMIDRLLRQLFPSKHGYVVDGKETLSTLRTEFIKAPDQFLETHQPAWFIFTPVINSGMSLEGNYFDAQFEYVTPTEGASQVAQRGERNRQAIGRTGKMTTRHIFYSRQGTLNLEAFPEVLDEQYWTNALAQQAQAPVKAAADFAKRMGFERSLELAGAAASAFTAQRPELPKFLVLKAFDTLFRDQLLQAEWASYGWQIEPAPAPTAEQMGVMGAIQTAMGKITIGLAQQRGRTLKLARSRPGEADLDDVQNPLQAIRRTKANLEKALGTAFLAEQDDTFYTAWFCDGSQPRLTVRNLVRGELFHLAISQPDQYRKLYDLKALKLLAGKPDIERGEAWLLPELPAPAGDIELVHILTQCPGLTEIINGQLARWTAYTPAIQAAADYLVSHQRELAANGKRLDGKGLDFSAKMNPAQLVKKALELLGHQTQKKRAGTGKRYNEHWLVTDEQRFESAATALDKFEGAAEMTLKHFRAELRLQRAVSVDLVRAAATTQLMAKIRQLDRREADIKAAIMGIYARHPSLKLASLQRRGDGGAAELSHPGLIAGQASQSDPIPIRLAT